jgi:glycosyltransferase involved in cell wall biosynthesis
MKVLFAIAHLNKGGGQVVQVLQLVRRLGPVVDGELLTLRAAAGPAPTVEGVDVRVVGDLRMPRGLLDLRGAIRERHTAYDLVQAFDQYYSLPAARLAGARPLVVRMGAHPTEDLGSRYGAYGRNAARVANLWLFSRTTVVVNAGHLRPTFAGRSVVCIPNGVDSDRFHTPRDPDGAREHLGLPRGVPLVVFTGKIIPRKNVQDLYWLARELPALHVALVGNDREEYYGDRYHREVRAAFPDVLPRVHATGEVSMDQIPAYLEAADLFVFPSRLEGMPNSVLEAWAAGLPVVAADTEAHREIFSPATGVLYRERGELKAAVEGLLAEPARARAMGEAGRRFVVENHSLDAAARRYLDLYASLAAGTSRDLAGP